MMKRTNLMALLGASLFLGTSAAMATLTIDRDTPPIQAASDPASCPPDSCSVVLKTAVGGEPSRVIAPVWVPPSASQPARSRAPVMVATTAP